MWNRSQTTKRSQTAPVQSEERSVVGQYVNLGKRRAAVKKMLERVAVRRARYQTTGSKLRVGALTYDPTIIPDIREWLKAQLGRIAGPAPGSPADRKSQMRTNQGQ